MPAKGLDIMPITNVCAGSMEPFELTVGASTFT
jgi:hypothetical protein